MVLCACWCGVYMCLNHVCVKYLLWRERESVCGICYGVCVCIYVHMRKFKMIGMSLHNGKAGFD